MNPVFLSLEDILEIHAAQAERFGGDTGLRDAGLLDSAIVQPMMTFGGQFVHEDLPAMAAAYLFHIVSNHPFVDGNKCTGYLAALVFLEINGVELACDSDELYLYELTLGVARGDANKGMVVNFFLELARS